MYKRIIILCGTLIVVAGCQTPYTNWHSYRNKSNDYQQGKVIAPLKTDGLLEVGEDMYPVPPENLRGEVQAPDLWPPNFPKKSS